MNAADRRRRHDRTQRIDSRAMGQIHMMDRPMQRRIVAQAGRVLPAAVAEQREHRRLVERRKPFDAVAVSLRDNRGIVREPSGAVARGPAAKIVERLRQVPMIETQPGLDARREQRIDQAIIECEALFVRLALAQREHARPRHREAVGADAEIAHQRDVLRITVIVVAGNVAGLAIVHVAGAAKRVPDAGAATVFIRRAFNLIGRGRDAPDEIGARCWSHGVLSGPRDDDTQPIDNSADRRSLIRSAQSPYCSRRGRPRFQPSHSVGTTLRAGGSSWLGSIC